MSEVEKLVDIINDFFGCDAAYFDVNPFDLATHLINKGVRLPVCCESCSRLKKCRVALVCEHPNGLKNPAPGCFCSFGEQNNQLIDSEIQLTVYFFIKNYNTWYRII